MSHTRYSDMQLGDLKRTRLFSFLVAPIRQDLIILQARHIILSNVN